jgi:hypothetical protein
MSGADDVVRAEWPESVPPVQGQLEALVLAQDFIVFVLNLFEAINSGTISPTSFAEDTTFQGAVGSVRIRTRYTQPELKADAWNLLFSAIAITSQAADRALCDALGKRPLDRDGALPIDELPDFEAAWTLVYMIRCAFAHDPFNPRWECKGRYRGTLQVTALGLPMDLRLRNGERLQSAELGGLGGYLSLLRFLHDQLKIRLPQTTE